MAAFVCATGSLLHLVERVTSNAWLFTRPWQRFPIGLVSAAAIHDVPGRSRNRWALVVVSVVFFEVFGVGFWMRLPTTKIASVMAVEVESPPENKDPRLAETEELSRAAAHAMERKLHSLALTDEQKGLALLRAALPANDPRIAVSLKSIARLQLLEDEAVQAIRSLDEAIKILRDAKPAAVNELADCVFRRAKLCSPSDVEKARGLYTEAANLFRKANPPQPNQLADCLCELAAVHANLRDFSGVAGTIDEALPLLRKAVPPRPATCAMWICRRAQLYLEKKEAKQGRAAARSLLEEARGLWPQGEVDNPTEHAGGLAALAWIYRTDGDAKKATAVSEEAEEFDQATSVRAKQLIAKAKYDPALGLLRDRVELAHILRERDLGEIASRLTELGELQEFVGFYPEAEQTLGEALKLLKQSDPKGSRTVASALALQARVYERQFRIEEAQRRLITAVKTLSRLPGIGLMEIAPYRMKLGMILANRGVLDQAEVELTEAAAELRASRPPGHPDRFQAILNLSRFWSLIGRNDDADAELAALTTEAKNYAADEPLRVDFFLAIGERALRARNFAEAKNAFNEAIASAKAAYSPGHPDIAMAWNSLAGVYTEFGAMSEAEHAFRQAHERLWALPYGHPKIGLVEHHWGSFYYRLGRPKAARVLLLSALKARRKVLPPDHPDIAMTLDSLGLVYESLGEYDQAENALRNALSILEKQGHIRREGVRLNLESFLAERRRGVGKTDFRATIQTLEEFYPAGHPSIVQARQGLFSQLFSSGNVKESRQLAEQSLRDNRALFEKNAGWQSERQQLSLLNHLRGHLDNYLSAAHAAGTPAAEVYAEVLAWKGAVTIRQERQRAVRHALDPSHESENLRIQGELREAVAKLEALNLAPGRPEKSGIEDLTRRCEALDEDLGRLNRGYRVVRDARLPTVAEIQVELARSSQEIVLMDFLEHQFLVPPKNGRPGRKEDRMSAFVVRPGRPVVWVDLGTPDRLNAAVEEWRYWTNGGVVPVTSGALLRTLIWEPLEVHVRGAKIVLLSLDGSLARVPFAALPGDQPGEFLLHKHMFAVVPSAVKLTQLQARRAETRDTEESLLLVGDVNYNAPDEPNEGNEGIPQLPNAAIEIRNVGGEFRVSRPGRPVKELTKSAATRIAYMEEASKYRCQLVTTHGFFESPPVGRTEDPAVIGRMLRELGDEPNLILPGLSSGLWFAGANGRRGDAGLTAATISELDLRHVELVILSACATGSGEVIAGEGAFSLQRAYQLAGAGSVVASWWDVNDRATRELVTQFCRRLWKPGSDGRPVGRLASLHAAQLWMLENYRLTPDERAKANDLRRGPGVGPGKPISESASTPGSTHRDMLPPHYWAGFVLSGDWQ